MTKDVKSYAKGYVGFGFAWEKVADCTADARWHAIKRDFKKTNESPGKCSGVNVAFGVTGKEV